MCINKKWNREESMSPKNKQRKMDDESDDSYSSDSSGDDNEAYAGNEVINI